MLSEGLDIGFYIPLEGRGNVLERKGPGDVRPVSRRRRLALSDRFLDRTIPPAVTLLLREEGGPLHVNEIYNRLLEGGFRFTGQNPTISVAVSLNRM